MLHALTAILICQVLGETAARALHLPVPGPVLGMVLMLGLLVAVPRLMQTLRATALGILAHMSLLFVPAGVGVVGHLATLGDQTAAILLAVVGSTIAAIAAGAVTFAAVARLTGSQDD